MKLLDLNNSEVVIIFGINGQDGYYLKNLLKAKGYTVIGVSRSDGDWIRGDIAVFTFVKNLIHIHQPVFIFHLAASSTTKHEVLFENHSAIGTGTLNILETVRNYSPHTKVFISGSALQFKNEGKSIKESDEFDPKDIYSVQRVYSVYTARYFRSMGIKVYVGYFFHHDSPMRPERHLNMKIVEAAKRIKAGSNELIEIGNPDVIKEYNHAADMMEAIWILVNQENVFESVIGSGLGYTISNWIITCANVLDVNLIERVKINLNFKAEFEKLISDPKTLRKLGWQPKYSLNDLAKDMIFKAN